MALVTLVTGCSSGFGLLTVLAFARAGHPTVATVRDRARAEPLERARSEQSLPLEVATLDVTDDASVQAAVAEALAAHGRLDVVVNNAGAGIRGAIEEVGDADARAVFETNLFGVLRVVRAVVPIMRAQGSGRIVNVSSVAGLVSAPFGGVYSATKYALEAVTEALHYELGPFGIRALLVEPGGFPTAFDANRLVAADDASPYRELLRHWEDAYASLPGRDAPADPGLVASTIVELATAADPPLRTLVGSDAELIGRLRSTLDDDAFEAAIRSALDYWDGARPAVAAHR